MGKYWAPGSNEPEEYNGGRTAGDIVKWAEERFAENIPPPEVVQAVSEAAVTGACENHPLCVIAFLPHILDCQSACRNSFIKDLTKLGDKLMPGMARTVSFPRRRILISLMLILMTMMNFKTVHKNRHLKQWPFLTTVLFLTSSGPLEAELNFWSH